ncbi:siderophore-interacting protein [Croceicoccus naphthovorans]|uniref:Uncharacterized protein n=2 Tax=Croceicoccus naphthovorans TaxID=1348774 RepID=A0A0G3XLH6_9SPHN|nr:siderophore-interacting protein [Croceicoccus naphthovorans]AKM11464.1 hypothetical protein AB433_02135 [Croceicoccus naphthovorans]MBB3991465.1 NADPH-dependent ferric siderophore reductase [Croceicoccus naphthovorans]
MIEGTARPAISEPKHPAPQRYTVLGKQRITPNMMRVTLGGDGMATLRPDAEGGYFKLRFAGDGEKPAVRSYTIRHQRADSVDVDFVVHGEGGHAGPAVEWALSVEVGFTIEAGGPGPAKQLRPDMDRYLIAGDMTALPAIGVNLAALTAKAKGLAVIEVQSEDDKQDLIHPAGVEVRWLVNPEPGTQPDLLADALRDGGWSDGTTYGWAAAEFGSMQGLRAYLRDERGLDRDHLYISSYWKYGEDDAGHRAAKQVDGALAG